MKPLRHSPLALAVSALLAVPSVQAGPAIVDVYLFEGAAPVAGATLGVDGREAGRTSAQGGVRLNLPAGEHRVSIGRAGAALLELPIALADDEQVQVSAALYPGRAPVYRLISSLHGESTIDLAQTDSAVLAGTLRDAAGAPIAGAEVTANGASARSDAAGRFVLRTRPGVYPIQIVAAGYDGQHLPATPLQYGENPALELRLAAASALTAEADTDGNALAGDAAAPAAALQGIEVEAKLQINAGGQFEAAEERREAAQIAETLSAEQVSRAGDSDAAGALKRVTGLSLVDGRFVYVRGMGERYSSVLLNGAQIPSPDPTRRVVPLDLFPAELLDRVLVQKAYSADMPGEFGGGTIQLRTRAEPEQALLRAQASVGYADGTTGEQGLRSDGGSRDWLSRDDGFRAAPEGLFQRPLPPRGSAELTALGSALAAKGFAIGRKDIGPNTGAALAGGNAWQFADDEIRIGVLGAARYAQNWDQRQEQRAEYAVLGDGRLVPQQRYDREQLERNIDNSLFLTAGGEFGADHRLSATVMQLRQTQQDERIDQGLRGSGNVEQAFSSEWVENQLTTRQLAGEHRLPALGELALDWQYTRSRAEREAPFARSYVFSEIDDGVFGYSSSFPPQLRYEGLVDDADQARLQASYPLRWSAGRSLDLQFGLDRLQRERDSAIHRFSFRNNQRPPAGPLPIDQIINPGTVASGTVELLATGRATDFYAAEQALDAGFLAGDLRWDAWRVHLGLRRERNDQQVVTRDPFQADATPIVARIDRADVLPAGSLTWSYADDAQLRFGYSETVSRPDFRELSRAPYTDPLLDVTVIGNPDLRQADIRSIDLRWETYFSPLESLSIALFRKDFTRPIELVRTPASGDLLELRNADSARNRGIEIDYARSLAGFAEAGWLPAALRDNLPWADLSFGLNAAWIDSEIDLGASTGIQTSARRPLQGQSPYLANAQLGWMSLDGDSEATLLYHVAGKRISRVGESGVPDEYEQAFGQVDFSYSRSLPWDGWKLKLRLRNLTDPEVSYRQGDEVSRRYRKGREAAFSVEWQF